MSQTLHGYLDLESTRQYLGGIGRMTLYRLETVPSRGFPRPYRIGSKKLFKVADLDAWMQGQRDEK